MRLSGWACCAMLAVCVVSASGPSAQDLPALAIDSFPRDPIAGALTEARTHPADAARVGRLGMVLHAWGSSTRQRRRARARTLERRFDWFYLGGLAETRRAHHAQAAELLTQAVALSPESVPARLALADEQFECGSPDTSGQLYRALAAAITTTGGRWREAVGRRLGRAPDRSGV